MPYSDLLTDPSPKKKEAKNFDLHSRKSLAEVHGNRTHLPPSADGTPDLKSGGPTSEPRTSVTTHARDISGSARGWRSSHRDPIFIINPVTLKDNPVPGLPPGAPGRARSQASLAGNQAECLGELSPGRPAVRFALHSSTLSAKPPMASSFFTPGGRLNRGSGTFSSLMLLYSRENRRSRDSILMGRPNFTATQ